MPTSLIDLSEEFAGRRAVVTGGSRGIGAAVAQRLIDGGASVVAIARTPPEDAPAGTTFLSADLRDPEAILEVAAQATESLGGVDILVNNAGAVRPYPGGISSIPDDAWLDSFDINLRSVVRLTNALLPSLEASASGVIVNVSAPQSRPPSPPMVHYGALKAALNAYSASLAQELAPARIRVNTVSPGGTVTPGADEVRRPMVEAMGVPAETLFEQMIPLGRLGQAWEIAETIAYLASDRASWVTGANYFIDGGMQIRP